jgi:hypothetical protein
MSNSTNNNQINTSDKVNEVKTFTKKLSEEEYKKQGEETTKKALEELNKIMSEKKHLGKPVKFTSSNKLKLNKDDQLLESSSDNFSDSDYSDDNPNDNLLISNAMIIQKQLCTSSDSSRKRRRNDVGANSTNQNDLYQLVVAQRELELQKNMKLINKQKGLECELDKKENEIYYLKLELSNKGVDYNNLLDKYKTLKSEHVIAITNYKNELKDEKQKNMSLESFNVLYILILIISFVYNIKFYMF